MYIFIFFFIPINFWHFFLQLTLRLQYEFFFVLFWNKCLQKMPYFEYVTFRRFLIKVTTLRLVKKNFPHPFSDISPTSKIFVLIFFFCLIKKVGQPPVITQPILNHSLIFASNCSFKFFKIQKLKKIKSQIWGIYAREEVLCKRGSWLTSSN